MFVCIYKHIVLCMYTMFVLIFVSALKHKYIDLHRSYNILQHHLQATHPSAKRLALLEALELQPLDSSCWSDHPLA